MGLIANVNVGGTWYGPAHAENEVTSEVREQITNPEAFDGSVALEPIGELPDGTSAEVLAWVGDDPDRSAKALAAERASDNPRSTLVARLEALAK